MKTILSGSYVTIFSFIGPEILLFIFPFIRHKKKILRSSLIGIGLVTLTYLFIIVISIGFYGVEILQYIIWPTVNILKSIKIPFFGRLEFIFILYWIGVAFTTVASFFYMSSFALTNLFRLKNQKISGLIVIPLILYLSTYPKNLIEIYNYSSLIGMLGSILAFLVPLSLLIISKLRKIKGETDDM
jgi:hypothetical protein